MKIRNSLLTKLMLALAVVLALFAIILNFYVGGAVKDKLVLAAQEKLASDMALTEKYLELRIPGEWSAQGDQLYKGTTLLNDNFEFVDEVGKLTGDTVTIFLHDTRVTTNVLKEGKRAVGTQVSEAVNAAVLQKGGVYVGEADVVGTVNQTIYKPIKDGAGAIVGILYVGVPSTPFDKMANDFKGNIYLISVLVLVGALIFCYLISRPVMKSIRGLVAVTGQIADKDLTLSVQSKSKDEIGQLADSFERMRLSLREMMTQVGDMSVQLKENSVSLSEAASRTGQTSQEVAGAIHSVAEGATEQSEYAHSIQYRMKETLRQVEGGGHKIQDTLREAVAAAEVAKRGDEAINNAIANLSTVTQTVEFATDAIHKLGKRSSEIGGIVHVISDIASQTNLLALNAAIEAARAGEHGRGFSVVASEVSKLAEQSKQSAERIRALIDDVQAETNETVGTMEHNLKSVEEQVEIITLGGQALKEIVAMTASTEANTVDVKRTLETLADSSQAVMDAIDHINRLVEVSATASEEAAASADAQTSTVKDIAGASKDVADIANKLNDKVREFKI
ncbi:methyl-accepting chemotaxis protein [Paenibacillus aurantiacus]|uniref:Methyl-accepting chemotaxis protein n=1 Tax=Paenibacillus aurantiacus TaxID=1936118 RepID=A0ABV5KW86_9BACL